MEFKPRWTKRRSKRPGCLAKNFPPEPRSIPLGPRSGPVQFLSESHKQKGASRYSLFSNHRLYLHSSEKVSKERNGLSTATGLAGIHVSLCSVSLHSSFPRFESLLFQHSTFSFLRSQYQELLTSITGPADLPEPIHHKS